MLVRQCILELILLSEAWHQWIIYGSQERKSTWRRGGLSQWSRILPIFAIFKLLRFHNDCFLILIANSHARSAVTLFLFEGGQQIVDWSNWRIYGYLYFKTKMGGTTGLIFEQHPPNAGNQYNLWRCSNDFKMIFLFLYRFQIFKDQCGSVPSRSVAVLG